MPKVWILKANFYDLRKAVVTERNDAQKAIFSTLEQKLQISNAFKNLLHLEFYLKKSFKTDVCYCREKFAINFSGSRALFILNLGCYFHFLKVKKNCQFSMILHLQDIHFGFIGLQNIKNWPEVVKSTVCIVWSCFFLFLQRWECHDYCCEENTIFQRIAKNHATWTIFFCEVEPTFFFSN